jgi:hypothetical protein
MRRLETGQVRGKVAITLLRVLDAQHGTSEDCSPLRPTN